MRARNWTVLIALGSAAHAARADDDAAALVRRADETTYLAGNAGLKSLQCLVRYQMTNGIARRMAYTFRAGATPPSRMDPLLDPGEDDWTKDGSEDPSRYCGVADRLVWKDWRAMLRGCELAVRRDGERSVVVVKCASVDSVYGGMELIFLAAG